MPNNLKKICTKCCEKKDISCFSKASQNKDGLHHNCKDCLKVIRKEQYERDKVKNVELKPLDPDSKKKCSRCGEVKSVSFFHKNKINRKDGLTAHCKQCQYLYFLEFKETHPTCKSHQTEYIREYRREYRKTHNPKPRKRTTVTKPPVRFSKMKIITVKETIDLIFAGKVTVIDVRSNDEYCRNHIVGSKNIPLEQLRTNFNSYIKEDNVIFVCSKGIKSLAVAKLADQFGLNCVYSMNGGMSAWIKNQMPIEVTQFIGNNI